MKKIIRLTENDLHKIVKNSVSRILNEIGDTPNGQKALGALHSRNVLRKDDFSDDVYKYAENSRGGDSYNIYGDNENDLYKHYSKGYRDYFNSHPQERAEFNRRKNK